ncbi:hypothetical protein TNIN_248191 [Trichonephila inaurata madagascariensis]|uniref:Uncharacterized protein n=1 Tax=Trichonephila inaurata madagascariensis TaxID=2747483 RepID=A0A8X6Y3I9_9ARAC|nr:hypothetical protein TNIN_248191 [Trichonephila inaurata madagascariensis]
MNSSKNPPLRITDNVLLSSLHGRIPSFFPLERGSRVKKGTEVSLLFFDKHCSVPNWGRPPPIILVPTHKLQRFGDIFVLLGS